MTMAQLDMLTRAEQQMHSGKKGIPQGSAADLLAFARAPLRG